MRAAGHVNSSNLEAFARFDVFYVLINNFKPLSDLALSDMSEFVCLFGTVIAFMCE